MQKIVNGIVIEYSPKDENLIKLIVDKLSEKAKKIMDFFELNEMKHFKIKIWDDLEKYKTHLLPYLKANNEEYHDWIIQHTMDGNINLLPIRLVRQTGTNKNMTESDIAIVACHEFVHICQQHTVKNETGSSYWFWEALATNLGNPEDFQWIKTEFKKYINFDEVNDIASLIEITNNSTYNYAFLVGNYMLKNYPHKKMLDYIKDEPKLEKDSEKILQEAKQFYKNFKKAKIM